MVKVKEELLGMGVDLDIAITDPFNRSRIVDGRDLGPAAAVEQLMTEGDEAAANLQQTPAVPAEDAGYTHEYPEQGAQPDVPGQQEGTPEQIAPQPEQPGQPPQPGQPGQPNPWDNPEQQTPRRRPNPWDNPEEEEDPNEMPKPMPSPKAFPMQEPGYIGKRKKGKPLVRRGPDPMTSKIRRSSSEASLVRLADRLDKQGQITLANKLDALITVINEE